MHVLLDKRIFSVEKYFKFKDQLLEPSSRTIEQFDLKKNCHENYESK